MMIIGVTIIGFARHGTHYLRMFFPEGAPIATAIILIPIELISYFSRPFSLAVRLFANMTVGHIILKVMGGFVVSLGAFYLVPGVVPFAFLSAVTELEFGIKSRSFKSFRDAALENNWARFYGGLHFHNSCIISTDIGAKVGQLVASRLKMKKK